MSHNGCWRSAPWPHLAVIACALLIAGCDDPGSGLVTSPEGKPAFDGAKPPPPTTAIPAIAFYSGGGPGGTDLKVMNADGSNVTAIYHTPYLSLMEPSWSPDGGAIAFIRNPYPDGQGWDLMLIDVVLVNGVPTGANPRVLLDRTSSLYHPAWSPDGADVAFTDSEARTLEVIPAAGGMPSVVYTSPQHMPRFPAWSRDSARIAFSEYDPAGTQVIRAVDVTTREVETLLPADLASQINPTGELIENIDWGRTQDVLIFNTGYNPRKIYTLAIPGGTPTFVVEGRGPSWSPDDAEIVFEGRKISRLNLATRTVTQLSASGLRPDWHRF